MAKSFNIVALVAAFCFSSLLSYAYAGEYLYVEGKVYCDTCRVEFQTKISENIKGAMVKLECRSRLNNTLSYTVESETDATGTYRLPVHSDHEEDICEVKLVKSPREDCNEKFKSVEIARVLLTKNVGVVQQTRFANALGFKKREALLDCAKVLQEMGIISLD